MRLLRTVSYIPPGGKGKMKKTINISLDRDLWDGLSKFAHEQSILQEKRFATIEALRMAVRVFLRLKIKEINQILDRDTRSIG